MKHISYTLVFFGIFLLSCGAALGTTFVDQTDNVLGGVWQNDPNDNNKLKLFFNVDPNTAELLWTDTVGDGFDTTQVDITNSGNDYSVSIYTQFDGFETIGSTEIEMADFFITDNSGTVYGVDLSWKGSSVYSAGLYDLGTSEYYITSQDVFRNSSNVWFGAIYDTDRDGSDQSTWKYINVDFNQSLYDYVAAITVTTQDLGSSYIYSFTLDGNLIDLSDGFSFFFATAECGNDVIHGVVVPEPGTMLLFGAGLLGFSVFARRKE